MTDPNEFIIHEEYGDYLLSVWYSSRTLIGCISPLEEMVIPYAILHRIRRVESIHETVKTRIGLGDRQWTYRFLCNEPGDINIVNGSIGLDLSSWGIPREWTINDIIIYLKNAIDND